MGWVRAGGGGRDRGVRGLAVGGGLGGGLGLWALWRPGGGSADVLLAGIGIGLVVVGVWWVSGRLGHLEEHPKTLEEAFLATNSQRMESLTFVAPIAYTVDWLIMFSDKSKVLTIAVGSSNHLTPPTNLGVAYVCVAG